MTLVLAALASVLSQGGAPYTLTFRGASGCPSEELVLADVRGRVRDASKAAGAFLSLEVTPGPSGFSGQLTVVDEAGQPAGQRRIEGATCAEVVQALAFFSALAIDLGGHLDERPPP